VPASPRPWRGRRKPGKEGTALAWNAAHTDLATLGLDDQLGHGQPQAAAATVTALELDELLEDPHAVGRAMPGPESETSTRRGPSSRRVTSVTRVPAAVNFDRVGEVVGHDLAQPVGIDHHLTHGSRIEVDLDRLCRAQRGSAFTQSAATSAGSTGSGSSRRWPASIRARSRASSIKARRCRALTRVIPRCSRWRLPKGPARPVCISSAKPIRVERVAKLVRKVGHESALADS
jgi:hypothetical protein